MMTVGELKSLLEPLNEDRIVILQKDAEGNGYSPLASIWEGSYQAENTWRGEVGCEVLTDELRASGYTEEDIIDGEPAVILVPVN